MIENDSGLEYTTKTVMNKNGEYEDVNAQVFFLVSTKDGSVYTLPAHKTSDGIWSTEENVKLGDYAPTGVRVLYGSGKKAAAPIISIEGEGELKDENGNGLVDHVYSIGMKPGFTSSWEDKTDMLALFGMNVDEEVVSDLDTEEDGIWTDIYPDEEENPEEAAAEPHVASAELFADTKTTSDLFTEMAAQMGDPANGVVDDPEDPDFETKDGIKSFTAINITQAQARSGRFYEKRTWTDEPSWTDRELEKRLRKLKEYGYKVSSMTEPQTQHEFLLIRGTLYYDKYGDPVPSLYVRNNYSGIVREEVSDRIMKNGELVGSILDVQYIYDVQGRKWARMQSVTMPPNVTCPIHTSRSQIPNTKERALRFTPASDVQNTASLMEDRKRNGGVRLGFKISKVSGSTAVGFAISLTGADWEE